jgi:hypothetical protein
VSISNFSLNNRLFLNLYPNNFLIFSKNNIQYNLLNILKFFFFFTIFNFNKFFFLNTNFLLNINLIFGDIYSLFYKKWFIFLIPIYYVKKNIFKNKKKNQNLFFKNKFFYF